MKLLLDTHVVVWLVSGTPRLGARSTAAIDQTLGRGAIYLSAVTFWEVALLAARGRLAINGPEAWRRAVLDLGVTELPLDGDVAIRSALLADAHRDPADRFIMATALVHRAMLVTADEKILAWPGPLDRLDAAT